MPSCGIEVLDGAASLAEQSLLRVIEDAHADARFLMLETIREFAIERLEASAESATLRDRHATAYLELARDMAPRLYTRERRVWLDRFEDDHDNLRAAIAWRMATGDVEAVADLLLAMWRFWQSRGHLAEGRMRADQVLAMPGYVTAPVATRIAVLEVAGRAELLGGRHRGRPQALLRAGPAGARAGGARGARECAVQRGLRAAPGLRRPGLGRIRSAT